MLSGEAHAAVLMIAANNGLVGMSKYDESSLVTGVIADCAQGASRYRPGT